MENRNSTPKGLPFSAKAMLVLLALLGQVGLLMAQTVDVGIRTTSNTNLEVYLVPQTDMGPAELAELRFTFRWPINVIPTPTVTQANYGLSQYGMAVSGGYTYRTFRGTSGESVQWLAGQEYVALAFSFNYGGGCGGTFELANDAWTASNGLGFLVTLGGADATGQILPAASSAGDLSPIVVNSVSVTDVTCFGGDNGIISVSANAYAPPLGYSLDGITYDGFATKTNLEAGGYTLYLRDNNGCQKNLPVTVDEPGELLLAVDKVDVTVCSDNANGSISLAGSGGNSSSYEYSIGSGFQGSGEFEDLLAGSYTATVRDANNCQTSQTVVLGAPMPIQVFETHQDVFPCNGDDNGSISATATGGTGALRYSLDAGLNTQASGAFNGLSGGSYTLVVLDQNNCLKEKAVSIFEPTAVTIASQTFNHVSTCFGDNSGSIIIAATGGTSPLSYSIDGTSFSGSGIFNNLTADDYTITIKDANNCFLTSDFTITQPAEIVFTSQSSTNLQCFGASNGTITVTASGGTGALNYSVDGSNYRVDGNFTGLNAGTYEVHVRDARACVVTQEFVLTQPADIVIGFEGSTNVTQCAGNDNGTITLVASGGTGTLAYSLNEGTPRSDGNFTGLAGGSYEARVTDQNECFKSRFFTLTEPPAIVVSYQQSSNVSCFGGQDGAITVFATGGTGMLSYGLDGGSPQSTGVFANVAAGTRVVSVTDQNTCVLEVPIAISEPPILDVSLTAQTDVLCNGATTGSLTVQGTGGTGVRLFSLQGVPGEQVEGSFPSLGAGSYRVYVRDINQCRDSLEVSISEPSAIEVLDVILNSSTDCNNNDGSVTVIGSGGTPPLQYAFNGGAYQSNGSFSNLYPGAYFVDIRDAHFCTLRVDVALEQDAPIVVDDFTYTTIDCHGNNNGTINIAASGGQQPIQYSINGVDFYSTGQWTNLPPDNYIVIARDANNCQKQQFAYINEPLPITIGVQNITNVSVCAGNANGSFTASAAGGVAPLRFTIDGTSYQGSGLFTGLGAASYTLTVKDANECLASQTVSVMEPMPITIQADHFDITCFGMQDGKTDIVVQGGAPPYAFLWDNGQQTQDLFNLGPGTYNLEVRDQNSCVKEASVTIDEPIQLDAEIVKRDISCYGAVDGQANLMVQGGTQPYRFRWSNGSGAEDLVNMQKGAYNVRVVDESNCETFAQVIITEPEALALSHRVEDVAFYGQSDGSIDLTVRGGTLPYLFQWSDGSADEDLFDIEAGDYSVIVTDANFCYLTGVYKVDTENTNIADIPNAFSPNGDGINDIWTIRNIQKYPNAVFKVFDHTGVLVYEEEGRIQGWNGQDMLGRDMPSHAIYYYTIYRNEREAPLTGSITLLR